MNRVYIVLLIFLVVVLGTTWYLHSPDKTGAPRTPQTSPGSGRSQADSPPASSASPAQGSSSAGVVAKANQVPVVWNNLASTTKVVQYHSDALLGGARAEALIRNGDQCYELQPNQVGQFDQITVPPKANLKVQMAYPDGEAGDVVALEVEDGGKLNGKGIAALVQLDNNHQLEFNFAVNQEEGIYRVAARKGGDTKMLVFWVSAHQTVQ